MGDRTTCITLDLEEDWSIPDTPNRNPTFRYLDDYISMVQELEVPLSVFVVGQTLERYPAIVDRLDSELEAEFHLHSYQHDMTKSYDFSTEVKSGIRAYRDHFDADPIGYRAPQGKITPTERIQLESAGFKFDASVFPSYRPGVYNNLRAPLIPHQPPETEELVEIPFGAVPYLRIPIAMNYLKLLGTPYIYLLKRVPLPSVIVFDSHLQDYWLTEFHSHLPNPKRSLMTRNIDRATEMFRDFVRFVRADGFELRLISSVYEEATRP